MLILSNLAHTWLLDLDGTILKHNGHLEKKESLLPGVSEFFDNIPKNDYIIIITARSIDFRSSTIEFLNSQNLRYDHIIFGVPTGERILINDIKASGLKTAFAFNCKRNIGLSDITYKIDYEI